MTSILPLIARRILVSVVILFIVSALLFCILRLLPVDPAAMSLPPNATLAEIEAKRHEMGLDQPLFRQYLIWAGQVLHGDFGTSIHFRRGVAGLIGSTLPATIELALLAMIVAGTLGIAGGLYLFHVRGTRKEPIADAGSIVLLSLPEFLWGLFFILLFGVALELLPFTGRLTAGFQRPVVTGFLLLDTLLVGRPDMFRERAEAHDPAVARARHRVRADHHARAALEPARRLSGGLHPSGAAARLFRAAHPAAPCAEERDPADA